MAAADRGSRHYIFAALPRCDGGDDGKVDEVDVKQLGNHSQPDFFYLDDEGFWVMATANASSELRQLHR
jgi:hypothetical protein